MFDSGAGLGNSLDITEQGESVPHFQWKLSTVLLLLESFAIELKEFTMLLPSFIEVYFLCGGECKDLTLEDLCVC